jgi:hypothetical protein
MQNKDLLDDSSVNFINEFLREAALPAGAAALSL